MLQIKAKEAIVAEIGSNRSKTYLEPCMICLSLVSNRGKPIEGAGEGEPITSAIDMRDFAKAGKKLAGVPRTGAQNNKTRYATRPASPTQIPLREPLCSIVYSRQSPGQPRARSCVRFFRTPGLAPSPLPLRPPTQAARVHETPGTPRLCPSGQF